LRTIHNVMVDITATGNLPPVQLPVDLHPQVQFAQAGVVYYFDIR